MIARLAVEITEGGGRGRCDHHSGILHFRTPCPKGEGLRCGHRKEGGGGVGKGLGCDHRSGILQHRIFLPQCSLGSIAATEDK